MDKERANEIAYGLLILALSKQNIELDPDKLKRKLGGASVELAKTGVNVTKEEVRAASEVIIEDLVKYAFNFSCKSRKSRRKKG
ncbi:hypothetical protein ACFL2R_03825 [Patescibacteria group bacterium]